MKPREGSPDPLSRLLAWWRLRSLDNPDQMRRETECIADYDLSKAARALTHLGPESIGLGVSAMHHLTNCQRCLLVFSEAHEVEAGLRLVASYRMDVKPSMVAEGTGPIRTVILKVLSPQLALESILSAVITPIENPGQRLATAGASRNQNAKGWEIGVGENPVVGEIFLIEGRKLRFQRFPKGTKVFLGEKLATEMRASFAQIQFPETTTAEIRIELP